MPHALVTGGAGFIGSHLVDSLLRDRYRVTVLDNFDPFYDRVDQARQHRRSTASPVLAPHRGRHPRRGDGATRCRDDIDVIVHLAAAAGVRPSIADPVRVSGSQRRPARRTCWSWRVSAASGSSSSPPRAASTASIRDVPWSEDDHVLQPISPYASTKISGELLGHVYAHLHGIRFLALRFFTVYGPRQRPDLAINKFARPDPRRAPDPALRRRLDPARLHLRRRHRRGRSRGHAPTNRPRSRSSTWATTGRSA